MTNEKYQTIKQAGMVLIALTVFVVATNLPYDEFHGWWIFGYTEHVVPMSYLVSVAWFIALIYMVFFVRWYSQQQPEHLDWQQIAKAVLGGGIISILLSMIIELQFTNFQPAFAGVVEELCKFTAMWLIFRRDITNMQSGIFYAVLCAIGFACLENIGYFIHYEGVLIMRGDPAHAVFSSFWGAAYGACKAKQLPWRLLWLKWMPVGVLFHAAFNTLLVLALYPLTLWIAIRFIINHKSYFELILGQRTFREFLWRKHRHTQ